MKNYLSEITVALLLVLLAGLLLNPYWMPMGALWATLVCFVVLVGGFAAFIWKENGGDERDALIRHVASRTAYLAGALVMALGIVYETLVSHSTDTWLVIAFIVTVLGKTLGQGYGKSKY